MSAVQLNQLQNQLDQLVLNFDEPPKFKAMLVGIFEKYADLTYRAGQAVRSSSLIESYHIPTLILQQLDLSIATLCQQNPIQTLQNADFLWTDAYLETRQVAVILISHLPVDFSGEALQRIKKWSESESEIILVTYLVEKGSVSIRYAAEKEWLDLIGTWTESGKRKYQQIGLLALTGLAQDHEFVNIPEIYSILMPLALDASQDNFTELMTIFEILAKRSASETTYYLKQILASTNNAVFLRLYRRIIPIFPTEYQLSLRAALNLNA